MKNFCSLLICLYFIAPLTGQEYSTKFGEVGPDELSMTTYKDDPEAGAVVFHDIGKSRFVRERDGFDVIYERKTKLKVLKESGIKWANIEIPYYQEGNIIERVYDIVAYTYNFENGQLNKTPLDLDKVYEEKINDAWKVKKLALPNVKVGSVIEYNYKISSQHVFNLRDWEFQWKIPVIHSEYELRLIPFYGYSWTLQGASKFHDYKTYLDKGLPKQFGAAQYNEVISHFVMKDIPAFNSEVFITSINDYIIKLDFQLSKVTQTDGSSRDILTTWEDMISSLSKNQDFGIYLRKSTKMGKKLIDESTLAGLSDNEKFNHIIDFVKHQYSWNGLNGKYASDSPKKITSQQTGNAADLNLLTTGFLLAHGIEAYPVVISTRSHGKVWADYPYAHFFNYVIIMAKIEGQFVLSDVTEVLNLNNQIPPRCINNQGLVVDKSEVKWVSLESPRAAVTNTIFNLHLTQLDEAQAEITQTFQGYDGLYLRKEFEDNQNQIEKSLSDKGYDLVAASIKSKNYEDKTKRYTINYKVNNPTETINDKIYIAPFLSEVPDENPLKQKKRSYPVDMEYPKKKNFKSTILIPENYRVDYLPEDQIIDNELFSLHFSVHQKDQKIVVVFSYFFKKTIYQPTEYAQIKSYFDMLTEKGNDKIVLVVEG